MRRAGCSAALLVLGVLASAAAQPPPRAAGGDGGARRDGGSDGGSADGGVPLGPEVPLAVDPAPLCASNNDNDDAPRNESRNDGAALARRYAALLLAGRAADAQLLHDHEGGRRPDLSALVNALAAHGPARSLFAAPVLQNNAETVTYFFTARFDDGDVTLRISVDHAGHIAGAAASTGFTLPGRLQRYDRHDQYRTRAALALPFRGVWTAINASPGGGNGHFQNANQRFAIDFLMRRGSGRRKRSNKGAGRVNQDYYAFGQPILAPADGKVVQVVDGVPDNTPGQVDVYFRLGNMVVIELGRGEYAYLCHLQLGSTAVRVGERVRRGQVIARCGNSGNSTEPHLHFQLADGPQITRAASLPAHFRRCHRNGKPVAEVLPGDGDELSQEAPARAR